MNFAMVMNISKSFFSVFLGLMPVLHSGAQSITSFTGTEYTTKDGITYRINSTKMEDGTYPALVCGIPSTMKGHVEIPDTFHFTINGINGGGGIPPGGVSWVQAPRKKEVAFGPYDHCDWDEEGDKTEEHIARPVVVKSNVFANRNDITEITLPNSVLSIWNNAFQNCSGLKSFIFPSRLKEIGDCFYGCSSLETVVMNCDVDMLPNSAFYGLHQLKHIIINCPLKAIPKSCFGDCINLESIKLPENLETIGEYAFYNCKKLEAIDIPSSLTTLEHSAFYACISLKSVTVPKGINVISDFAFYGCNSLNSLTILEGVDSIGKNAFYSCDSLNELTIPTSVKTIEEYAFGGESNLHDVYVQWVVPPTAVYNVFSTYNNLYFNGILHIPHSASGATSKEISDNYLKTEPWCYFRKIDDGVNQYDVTYFYLTVEASGNGQVTCRGWENEPVRESRSDFLNYLILPKDIVLCFSPDDGYQLESVIVYQFGYEPVNKLQEVNDGVLTLRNVSHSLTISVTFKESLLGVGTTVVEKSETASYYMPDGRQAKGSESGLMIERSQDGSVRKVIKR